MEGNVIPAHAYFLLLQLSGVDSSYLHHCKCSIDNIIGRSGQASPSEIIERSAVRWLVVRPRMSKPRKRKRRKRKHSSHNGSGKFKTKRDDHCVMQQLVEEGNMI